MPNRERRVSGLLTALDISHHIFKIRRECIHRGHVVTKFLNAFPRYIATCVEDEWQIIRRMGGVTGFVSYAGVPKEFHERELEKLRASADADGVLKIVEQPKRCRFQLGQNVQIDNRTAFAGHTARFQYTLPGGNAVVAVSMMGQEVPISVSEDDLFPIDRSKRFRNRRYKHKRNRYRQRETQTETASASV